MRTVRSLEVLALLTVLLAVGAGFCAIAVDHPQHSHSTGTQTVCVMMIFAVTLGVIILLRPWLAGRTESGPLLSPALVPLFASDPPPKLLRARLVR